MEQINQKQHAYNNKGVQRVIEENFDEDLYKDVNDIFGKGAKDGTCTR